MTFAIAAAFASGAGVEAVSGMLEACGGAPGAAADIDVNASLLKLVNDHGPRSWSVIAEQLPGRVGKQCRERYAAHHYHTILHAPTEVLTLTATLP